MTEPSPEPHHPHHDDEGATLSAPASASPPAVPKTRAAPAVPKNRPAPSSASPSLAAANSSVSTSSALSPLAPVVPAPAPAPAPLTPRTLKAKAAAVAAAKAANIKKLTPLEVIAMHRHRHGEGSDDAVLIRELEFILGRAISKGPSLCRTDLYGPDTLNVARSEAAMEYLKALGFVKVTEEVARKTERGVVYDVVLGGPTAASAASASSMTDAEKEAQFYKGFEASSRSASTDGSGGGGSGAVAAEGAGAAVVAGEGATPCSVDGSKGGNKGAPTVTHRHYLQLSAVPEEGSAEWQRFRQSVGRALAELEAARTTSCGLLRVMLHRFIFFENMATDYRVEVVVKEVDPYAALLMGGGRRTSAAPSPAAAAAHADADVDPEVAAALAAARKANGGGVGSGDEDDFVVLPDPSATASGGSKKKDARKTSPSPAPATSLAEETHISPYFTLDDATILPTLPANIRTAAPTGGSNAVSPSASAADGNLQEKPYDPFTAADDDDYTYIYGSISPCAGSASAGASPSHALSGSTGTGPRLPPAPTQHAGPARELTFFPNMLATFDMTKVASPCTIDVNVYRSRTVRGDKLKAVGTLAFDNAALLRREVDLKDPRAPAGLPIGRITVEIDSVRLRHNALALLENEKALERQREREEAEAKAKAEGQAKGDDGEGDADAEDASHLPPGEAPWQAQQDIIDAAARRMQSMEASGGQQSSSTAAAATGSVSDSAYLPSSATHTAAAIGAGGVVTGGNYTVGTYDADDYF